MKVDMAWIDAPTLDKLKAEKRKLAAQCAALELRCQDKDSILVAARRLLRSTRDVIDAEKSLNTERESHSRAMGWLAALLESEERRANHA